MDGPLTTLAISIGVPRRFRGVAVPQGGGTVRDLILRTVELRRVDVEVCGVRSGIGVVTCRPVLPIEGPSGRFFRTSPAARTPEV